MNRLTQIFIYAGVFLYAGLTHAVPTLQLDIEGGTYNTELQDMVSGEPVFNLYAYGTPNGESQTGNNITADEILATTYYLSIALTPQVDSPMDLGSIDVTYQGLTDLVATTHTFDVTQDFIYGTPPADATANPDINHGGYFDTYYLELSFSFDSTNTACLTNTQTDGGSAPDTSCSDMFYEMFAIDMTNLDSAYDLHFDLYTIQEVTRGSRTEIVRGDFAPYSHDASTDVPEPSSLALLGMGLLGVGLVARRRKVS